MEYPKLPVGRLLLLVFAVALIIYGVFHMENVVGFLNSGVTLIKPFLLGAVIAFILNVPLRFFEQKVFVRIKHPRFKKAERGVSILLSILLVWAILTVVVSVVVPQLVESVTLFISMVPSYYDYLIQFLGQFEDNSDMIADALKQIESISPAMVEKTLVDFFSSQTLENSILSDAFKSTVGVLSTVASGVVNFVVAFIFAIYILAAKEKLSVQARKICFALLNKTHATYVVHASQVSFCKLYSFITGQLTEAVILGSLCFLGMFVLRLPYAAMIGVLTGFCALIPIFGAFIGGAVGALLILTVSPMKALTFVIFLVILQQVEGNLIYPKVVGGSVGLPAMWTLFAITIGSALMGLVGMLLFVPLFAIIYCLFSEFIHGRLKRNDISVDDGLIQHGVADDYHI